MAAAEHPSASRRNHEPLQTPQRQILQDPRTGHALSEGRPGLGRAHRLGPRPGAQLAAHGDGLRQNWLRAYDFTTDRGSVALNDYARVNDPFARVGDEQVAVEISSVIRASDSSFRVAWTERRYLNGQLARTERWTAILTVVLQPPRTAEALRKNPLGVFVHAINWSRENAQ